MAKELRCADVGMQGCNFVARGKDAEDVMKKAADHARRDHGMSTIPPDVEKKARSVMREVPGTA